MRSAELADCYVATVLTNWERDADLYTPDALRWHNTDELDQPVHDQAAHEGLKLLREAVPDLRGGEVKVHSWEDGFAIQFVLTGTTRLGAALRIPACIIGSVRDGRIARLQEYLDSAQADPIRDAMVPAD